jgi:hypothetical protein
MEIPTNEQILETIRKNGRIDIHVLDSTKRKVLHEFASKNNLYHVSYLDKSLPKHEDTYSYYCSRCQDWTNNTKTRSCCDECSDFTIYCMNCGDKEAVYYELFPIWNQDSMRYDGLSERKTPRRNRQNNVIVLANNIELIANVFEQKKIKISQAKKWIQKREKNRSDIKK